MKTIYIGNFFPNDRIQEIRLDSKHGIDNAANSLQASILKGLSSVYKSFTIITSPAIRSWPGHYRKAFFKSSRFLYSKKVVGYCVGFINIPVIRHITELFLIKRHLKKMIDRKEEYTIIIYSIRSPFLKAVCDLRKNNANIKTCLIVPDLPQYMKSSKNVVYKFLKYCDSKILNHNLKYIDSFVLLTDLMADALKIKHKPWIRIEGMFHDSDALIHFQEEKEKYKTILYTGDLHERYGIISLMDAFTSISDDSYRLWICGEGSCRGLIEKNAMTDKRIKYFGLVTHEEVLTLQKRATILVNPRTSEGIFTKYSFPSKTMEYLASGTPCAMYKLPGVPQEYYDFVYIPNDESSEELKNTLIHVCSKSQNELNAFGEKASRFILEQKNPEYQVRKIYKMICQNEQLFI